MSDETEAAETEATEPQPAAETEPPKPAGTTCTQHPDETASGRCEGCGRPFCFLCGRPDAAGRPMCRSCSLASSAGSHRSLTGLAVVVTIVAFSALGYWVYVSREAARQADELTQGGDVKPVLKTGTPVDPSKTAKVEMVRHELEEGGIAISVPKGEGWRHERSRVRGHTVVKVIGPGKGVLIESGPNYPWIPKLMFRKRIMGRWTDGTAVKVPRTGIGFSFAGCLQWSYNRGRGRSGLFLVTPRRIVTVQYPTPGERDAHIAAIVNSIEPLAGDPDLVEAAIKKHGLSPDQAQAAAPAALVKKIEDVLYFLRDRRGRYSMELQDGIKQLVDGKLPHAQALILYEAAFEHLRTKNPPWFPPVKKDQDG